MNQLRLGYLNSVYLIGRLVADPELRYTQKGAPVCSFRIATTRRFKNRESGETHEETLYVTIVAWRRQAELVNDFLKKGSAVLIEGRLRSRQWETENKEKRSVVEVVAHRIQFLDAPEPGSEASGNGTIEAEEELKEENNIDTPF
ncbi:MAG: single-stranded DNA-binding protein [candidate division WOR-3 bacterium]|nr:single-stranded DNA-binding protein [candidate division WOR-3 bacterium]